MVREAREDIPPLYRARVWSALLKIDASYRSDYEAIEKDTTQSADRQVRQLTYPQILIIGYYLLSSNLVNY